MSFIPLNGNGNAWTATEYIDAVESFNKHSKTKAFNKYLYAPYTYWTSRLGIEGNSELAKNLKKAWPHIQFIAFVNGLVGIITLPNNQIQIGYLVPKEYDSTNDFISGELILWKINNKDRFETKIEVNIKQTNFTYIVQMTNLRLPIWIVLREFLEQLELIWKARQLDIARNTTKAILLAESDQDKAFLEKQLKDIYNVDALCDLKKLEPYKVISGSTQKDDKTNGTGMITLSKDSILNTALPLEHEVLMNASGATFIEMCRSSGIRHNVERKNERVMSKEMDFAEGYFAVMEEFTDRQYRMWLEDFNEKNKESIKLVNILNKQAQEKDKKEEKENKKENDSMSTK